MKRLALVLLLGTLGALSTAASEAAAFAAAAPPVAAAEAGSGPAVVRAPGGLNVRVGAATDRAVTATMADGSALSVVCQVYGERVRGTQRTSAYWDRLPAGHGHIADAFVEWPGGRPDLPWCGDPPTDATVPPASRQAFFARVAPAAQAGMRKYQVPASVTIAQAVLESGWGRSTLTRVDHSYFGMKCFGSPGPIAVGCSSYASHECSGSKCFATRADFRAYTTMADSFIDHGRLLSTTSRYAKAMRYATEPERFAREIHKAGYATSPAYADNLIDLMRQYDLTKYDRLP